MAETHARVSARVDENRLSYKPHFSPNFGVSNLEAAECSRDIDCTFKCRYGGICDDTNTKKCFCWPPKVFMEDARCINYDDCIKICTPGCKIH
ncbi:hypothetical protein J1N35_002048, partial [Gossypium stocksii]